MNELKINFVLVIKHDSVFSSVLGKKEFDNYPTEEQIKEELQQVRDTYRVSMVTADVRKIYRLG